MYPLFPFEKVPKSVLGISQISRAPKTMAHLQAKMHGQIKRRYLGAGADQAVGSLDGHVPDFHFAIRDFVLLVVQAQLHASHVRLGIPSDGLEVLRPLEPAAHASRKLHLNACLSKQAHPTCHVAMTVAAGDVPFLPDYAEKYLASCYCFGVNFRPYSQSRARDRNCGNYERTGHIPRSSSEFSRHARNFLKKRCTVYVCIQDEINDADGLPRTRDLAMQTPYLHGLPEDRRDGNVHPLSRRVFPVAMPVIQKNGTFWWVSWRDLSDLIRGNFGSFVTGVYTSFLVKQRSETSAATSFCVKRSTSRRRQEPRAVRDKHFIFQRNKHVE